MASCRAGKKSAEHLPTLEAEDWAPHRKAGKSSTLAEILVASQGPEASAEEIQLLQALCHSLVYPPDYPHVARFAWDASQDGPMNVARLQEYLAAQRPTKMRRGKRPHGIADYPRVYALWAISLIESSQFRRAAKACGVALPEAPLVAVPAKRPRPSAGAGALYADSDFPAGLEDTEEDAEDDEGRARARQRGVDDLAAALERGQQAGHAGMPSVNVASAALPMPGQGHGAAGVEALQAQLADEGLAHDLSARLQGSGEHAFLPPVEQRPSFAGGIDPQMEGYPDPSLYLHRAASLQAPDDAHDEHAQQGIYRHGDGEIAALHGDAENVHEPNAPHYDGHAPPLVHKPAVPLPQHMHPGHDGAVQAQHGVDGYGVAGGLHEGMLPGVPVPMSLSDGSPPDGVQ